MAATWGNTLLIANPVAQNGKSATLVDKVAGFLRGKLPHGTFSVQLTSHARHAIDLARDTQNIDTILVLGGDGIVHETANGLMAREEYDRPVLGVIPAGSGNDFAKALGLPFDANRACEMLLEALATPMDVGQVNDTYFVETLSFGLDAAIAIDTMARRKKTGRTGTLLYMESGFDQLMHHLDTYDYSLSLDGGQTVRGQSLTFAVQNGPYYGGGFKICPDASLTDGALDICIAHPPVGVLRACAIFLRAKEGRHVKDKHMQLMRASALRVEFDKEPPTQADGEQLHGKAFDVRVHPQALCVLMPQER